MHLVASIHKKQSEFYVTTKAARWLAAAEQCRGLLGRSLSSEFRAEGCWPSFQDHEYTHQFKRPPDLIPRRKTQTTSSKYRGRGPCSEQINEFIMSE